MKNTGFSLQLLGIIFAVTGIAGSLFMLILGALLGVGGLALVIMSNGK